MKELTEINLTHCNFREWEMRLFGVTPSQRSEFFFPGNHKNPIIISAINFKDEDFEHVMINPNDRLPTYEQMVWLKDEFWNESEVTMQVHPKESEYVNKEKYCLHLWRYRNIPEKTESQLLRKVKSAYITAREKYYKKQEDSIFDGEKLIIFGGKRWPTWNEVCEQKKKYWGMQKAAVQFNVGGGIDLNPEKCIILWDATDMVLPSKEVV